MLHVEGFSSAARAMINSGPRLVQEHEVMTMKGKRYGVRGEGSGG
jgi:hypothetical protein